MLLTDNILFAAFPQMTAATRKMVLANAPAMMARFEVNTQRRVVSFIGSVRP